MYIIELENELIALTVSIFGKLIRFEISGYAICSSIVFGLCPSHSTFNITCGADKSGRASKFVFFIAQNELSVKINITKRTKNLFFTLYEIIFSTIAFYHSSLSA